MPSTSAKVALTPARSVTTDGCSPISTTARSATSGCPSRPSTVPRVAGSRCDSRTAPSPRSGWTTRVLSAARHRPPEVSKAARTPPGGATSTCRAVTVVS